MSRATHTQFRDPREMSPPARMPKVTNTGDLLFNFMPSQYPSRLPKAKIL